METRMETMISKKKNGMETSDKQKEEWRRVISRKKNGMETSDKQK